MLPCVFEDVVEPEVPCVALDLTAVIGSSKSPSLQCEMLSNDPRVPTNEYNGTGDTFGRRVTSFTCLRLHEDRLSIHSRKEFRRLVNILVRTLALITDHACAFLAATSNHPLLREGS